ncbi:thiosulfate oxidation carrier protein SoxY [Methylomarinum sp. Ch1-1]|uniref:Thiosulfate oxidation carrier protein SoxY n=1 Tax=Methylomarinum roseum TaxID=3067653 RepID=A0AAU7NPW0_9GAMM|nr:thiosulfate oxidation carrier protein SoxY [Methylomarinum sp. Ch1-1]MDP4521062.1 thiosulfate oxidation carrier protein SoxY [Methylomarinum sp. Ch1-1]
MDNTRRQFLHKTASLSAFTVFAISGLITPDRVHAQWRKHHFADASFEQILRRLFKNREIVDSDQISIKAPKTAENGATVPITINSSLDGIDKLYLLVEKNPAPLSAIFTLSPSVDVYVKARIKMAESCDVVVIAASGKHLYRARRSINVTTGGCGG